MGGENIKTLKISYTEVCFFSMFIHHSAYPIKTYALKSKITSQLKQNGEPIGDAPKVATINILSDGEIYNSDSKEGTYKLKGLSAGKYKADISVMNEKTESDPISITFTVPVNPVAKGSTGTVVGVMIAIIISKYNKTLNFMVTKNSTTRSTVRNNLNICTFLNCPNQPSYKCESVAQVVTYGIPALVAQLFAL